MRIIFTPAAESQFLVAVAYIQADNPSAAVSFRNKAWDTLQRLSDFPESGRGIPEFPDLPHREVLVGPHRFFYRVKDDVIWIVAVWHDAQLPNQPSE